MNEQDMQQWLLEVIDEGHPDLPGTLTMTEKSQDGSLMLLMADDSAFQLTIKQVR